MGSDGVMVLGGRRDMEGEADQVTEDRAIWKLMQTERGTIICCLCHNVRRRDCWPNMNDEKLDKPPDVTSNPAPPAEGTQPIPQPAAPQVPEPPPPPKSIFDEVYEATDVNAPKQRIREDIGRFINESGLDYAYDFLFLYYYSGSISRLTSNRLYSAVTDPSHNLAK